MVNLVHYVLNLVKSIKEITKQTDSIESLKNRMKTEESKKALDIADLALFHKMVKENDETF